MLFDEPFSVLASEGQAHLREKGSRFFAYAFPVRSEGDIKQQLDILKVKHPDASHHCYAWQLGPDRQLFRANDDGEPSNSAGKPILRAIQKKNVTDALVVVVRYFGGTLLGIPGLIKAYGESASMALDAGTTSLKNWLEQYELTANFERESDIFKLIRILNLTVESVQKSENVSVTIQASKSQADALKKQLPEYPALSLTYIGQHY